MDIRIESRSEGNKNASVEFTPNSDQMIYHFKLRDFSSKGFGIMVKEGSKVLDYLKENDILEMNYYPDQVSAEPVPHKTQIKHISKPDPGTYKDHMIVGLEILE